MKLFQHSIYYHIPYGIRRYSIAWSVFGIWIRSQVFNKHLKMLKTTKDHFSMGNICLKWLLLASNWCKFFYNPQKKKKISAVVLKFLFRQDKEKAGLNPCSDFRPDPYKINTDSKNYFVHCTVMFVCQVLAQVPVWEGQWPHVDPAPALLQVAPEAGQSANCFLMNVFTRDVNPLSFFADPDPVLKA